MLRLVLELNMNQQLVRQHKTEHARPNHVLVQTEQRQQAPHVQLQKQNVHLAQLVDTKIMVPVKHVAKVQLKRHQDFQLLVFHVILDKQH